MQRVHLMAYEVKLPFFEGPLDLLIHLIRENEVDIYDIPIATITEQYLTYLEAMRSLNLDVAGEFLVMAATLTHIKSQMLLPTPALEGLDEEEGVDPRLQLVERLLEYQRYKTAAVELRQRELECLDSFAREADTDLPESRQEEGGCLEVGLFDLLAALKEVLARLPQESFHEITLDAISITDRINWLMSRLAATPRCVFQELFAEDSSRMEMIVTFQALLEVVRLRLVRLVQVRRFGPIHVSLAVEPSLEEAASDGPSASESHH